MSYALSWTPFVFLMVVWGLASGVPQRAFVWLRENLPTLPEMGDYGGLTERDVGKLVLWGGGAALFVTSFIGGAVTIAGGGGGIWHPPGLMYSAPSAPTATAVMISDTSGYANSSAFSGDQDDSVQYAIYEWDSLRGTGWDLVTPDTQTTAAANILRSDTLQLFTANDTFKLRIKHVGFEGGASAYSTVDTFVATGEVAADFTLTWENGLNTTGTSWRFPEDTATHVSFATQTSPPWTDITSDQTYTRCLYDETNSKGCVQIAPSGMSSLQVWIEVWARWPSDWTLSGVVNPISAPDHKVLHLFIPSGDRAFWKPGYSGGLIQGAGWQSQFVGEDHGNDDCADIRTMIGNAATTNPNSGTSFVGDSLWDGTWHRFRFEIDLGVSGGTDGSSTFNVNWMSPTHTAGNDSTVAFCENAYSSTMGTGAFNRFSWWVNHNRGMANPGKRVDLGPLRVWWNNDPGWVFDPICPVGYSDPRGECN